MPNWVENQVTITGDVREILKLATQLSQPYSTKKMDYSNGGMELVEHESKSVLSFYNVIPHPNDSSYYGDGTTDNQGNWYEWNCRNWGTKWNACDVGVSWCPDSKVLGYSFNTAWSPVEEIVEAISRQYPTLKIEYQWTEEQGFGGISSWSGGVKETEFDWSIPESHADFERIRSIVPNYYYGCVCEWADVEDWFADCPRPAEMFLENNNDNCLDPETLGTTTTGKE